MYDPNAFQTVLRRQEMTCTEWRQAERQAGQIGRALGLLRRGAAGGAQALRGRARYVPTATIETSTNS